MVTEIGPHISSASDSVLPVLLVMVGGPRKTSRPTSGGPPGSRPPGVVAVFSVRERASGVGDQKRVLQELLAERQRDREACVIRHETHLPQHTCREQWKKLRHPSALVHQRTLN